MTYRSVFYNEKDQRVWRTEKPSSELHGFVYCGKMTKVEFDFLLEILFCNFGDENISLDEFKKYFDLIVSFSENYK